MVRTFTDTVLSHTLISIEDQQGRKASLSFEDEEIVLHRSRPFQGRKARISYNRLLDLVAEDHPEFFAAPKRRKRI